MSDMLSRYLNRHHYLRAVFTRSLTGQECPEFRFYIFNHVYLLMSYNAMIWEQPGPLDVPRSSHDKYDDRDGVEVVLPVDLREVDMKLILDSAPGQLRNCVAAVVWVLGALDHTEYIKSDMSVDDLYFVLRDRHGPWGITLAHQIQSENKKV